MSSLNTQSASDRLKAGLLRAIRPRNDENSSDQITQKNTGTLPNKTIEYRFVRGGFEEYFRNKKDLQAGL